MRKVSLKRKRNGSSGENLDDSTTKNDENTNQNGGGDEDVDPLDGTEKVTSTTTKKKGGKVVKKGAKKAKTVAKSNNDVDEKAPQSENGDGDEDDVEEEKEEEYEVEDIIDHKTVRGKLQYLIRWKGYDADNDTWEPESTVNCPDIITRYNEKNEKSVKKGKPKKGSKEEEETQKDDEEHTEEEENDDAQSEKSLPAKKTTGQKGRGRPKQKKMGRPKKVKVDNNSGEDEDDDEELENDGVEYEVEKIIDVHFKRNGEREFLIRWKGFKSNADTWEPEDNVSCADLIEKFMKKVNDAKGKQSKDLRTDRNHTKRFTLSTSDPGRRLSKRYTNKQRVSYFENE